MSPSPLSSDNEPLPAWQVGLIGTNEPALMWIEGTRNSVLLWRNLVKAVRAPRGGARACVRARTLRGTGFIGQTEAATVSLNSHVFPSF